MRRIICIHNKACRHFPKHPFDAPIFAGNVRCDFFGLFTFFEKNDKINNETLYSDSVAEGVVR